MVGTADKTFNEWLLGCTKEHKQFLLKKAIQEEKVDVYFALTDIFLRTPISQGGLASDDIPSPADKFDFDEKSEK